LLGSSSGGTLSGVTLNGDLDVLGGFGSPAYVAITGGLTLSNFSRVLLGSSGAGNPSFGYLRFDGSQTLGGSGNVVFRDDVPNALWVPASGDTLTIGNGIMVDGTRGTIGASTSLGGAAGVFVVNNGILRANGGGTIAITGSGWTN